MRMKMRNRWQKFKKLWYFLIGKEYKVGWVSLPPEVVILNDEFIHNIELTSESDVL